MHKHNGSSAALYRRSEYLSGSIVKALLKLRNKKNIELAEYLGLTMPQALTNKFLRGSISADDLIKISAFLGCELAITFDNQKIIFDESDLSEKN